MLFWLKKRRFVFLLKMMQPEKSGKKTYSEVWKIIAMGTHPPPQSVHIC